MGKEAKFVVRLSDSERQTLEQVMSGPRVARVKALRARMLLKADADGPGWGDAEIAEAFDVSLSTVHRLRQTLVEEGFEVALNRRPLTGTKPRKLDGVQEARLVAMACGAPPKGRASWTMQLLADQLVELHVVDSICPETVRQTLKKTNSSLGKNSSGSSRRKQTRRSFVPWKTRWRSINDRRT